MNRFYYTARSSDGRKIEGEVSAPSPDEAAVILQQSGVYVTSLVPVRPGRKWSLPDRLLMRDEERIFLLESLATYLETGLPLQTALLRLRLNSRNHALARSLDRVQHGLDEGLTFSEALHLSRIFPASWVSILELGEERGDYVGSLRLLYRSVRDSMQMKRELVSLLIMPTLLLILVGVWFWLFVTHVVPTVLQFVLQVGSSSRFFSALNGALDLFGWVAQFSLVAVGGLFLLARLSSRSDQEMGIVQSWMPRWIPVLGPLVAQSQILVVVNGLKLQLEAGVAMVRALETLARGIPHRAIRRELMEAYWRLQQGYPAAEALAVLRAIPQEGQALLSAGDVSGKLPGMLELLSRDLQADLTERIKRLTLLLRYGIIIGACIMVGLLVVSFFSLLFSSLS